MRPWMVNRFKFQIVVAKHAHLSVSLVIFFKDTVFVGNGHKITALNKIYKAVITQKIKTRYRRINMAVIIPPYSL